MFGLRLNVVQEHLEPMHLMPLGWALVAAIAAPAAAARMAPLPPAAAAPKALNWQDCVALAALKNPALTSADYSLQSARASYYGSFNGLLPNLTLSNGYASSGVPAYTSQYAASINLFNMTQVASIKTAASNYTQAQASLRLASASLRFNLRQAFAAAFFADQNVEVSRRIWKSRSETPPRSFCATKEERNISVI